MIGDWFHAAEYGNVGDGTKAIQRLPPEKLTRWIITQSSIFITNGIGKVSRSVLGCVCLALTSQVQAVSTLVGNEASVIDTQQVFKSTFIPLINEDYSVSVDIERCQCLLEHGLLKVDFSIGTGIICFEVI